MAPESDLTSTAVELTAHQRPFSIAIIGGGLGGLALAIGLLRHNIPIQIYEAASEFSEIGAGVAFGPNTLQAITLIDPGLKAAYERCATRNGWREKKRIWLAQKLGVDVPGKEKGIFQGRAGDLLAEVEAGETGQCSVYRAKFLDELVKLIPEDISHFGQSLVDIKQRDGQEEMELVFHNGSTAKATAVVGCNGIKSMVRRILLGDDHPFTFPQFASEYAYRTVIPMDTAIQILGDHGARNGCLYLGYGGYVVTYPIDKHKLMNMVAVKQKDDGKWEHDEWVAKSSHEAILKDFEGWSPRIIELLKCVQTPDMWALFDNGNVPRYNQGNLCLCGDAAHPTTPHQGQGAGMAFEDAYVLSELIGVTRSSNDLKNTFKAFDAVRRPRTQRLVETSRAAGRIYAMKEDGIGDDLAKIRNVIKDRHDWIWNEDLVKEVEVARAMMAEMSAQ